MELIRKNLDGKHVCLELIEEKHREALRHMTDDPDIWQHTNGPNLGYDKWFDDALADTKDIIYVVREKAEGLLVGSTRYMNIVAEHDRLEVGATWYNSKFWGGVVNPSCKFLLLSHAFEVMGAGRLELKTSDKNLRSQSAIKKLGAKYEGKFRNHMINPDGSMRDTVMFAILRQDWPKAKASLLDRLSL